MCVFPRETWKLETGIIFKMCDSCLLQIRKRQGLARGARAHSRGQVQRPEMASRFGLAEVPLAKWKATRKSRPSLRLLLSLGLSVRPSVRPSVTVEGTERATTLAQQEEDTTNAAATALTASAAPPDPSSLIPFPSSLSRGVRPRRPARTSQCRSRARPPARLSSQSR